MQIKSLGVAAAAAIAAGASVGRPAAACAAGENNSRMRELQSTVESGMLYRWENYIDDATTTSMRDYIYSLRDSGRFQPSGLTNTAEKGQTFDSNDRKARSRLID